MCGMTMYNVCSETSLNSVTPLCGVFCIFFELIAFDFLAANSTPTAVSSIKPLINSLYVTNQCQMLGKVVVDELS